MHPHAIPAAPASRSVSSRLPLSLKRRVAFILICALFLLAFQEVLFRLVFPLPEVEGFNRSQFTVTEKVAPAIERFRQIGMGNQTIRHESEPDGFAFDHRLNLYGFRGPNFRLAPPTDRARVVFVGDSLTEGVGTSGEGTIPAQFARNLKERKTPVEAINLGVCGAGLPEYERLVQVSLELLHPSAIYVTLFVNDLPVDHPVSARAPEVPVYPRYQAFVPRIFYVVDRTRRGLPVYRAFFSPRRPANHAVPSPFNPLTTQAPPAGTDPAIVDSMRRGKCNPGLAWHPIGYDRMLRHDLTQDGGAATILGRIASACQSRGVRLTIAYIPAASITNPAYLSAQRRLNPEGIGSKEPIDSPVYLNQQRYLQTITQRLGIPFLDLTTPFIAAERAGRKLYWPYDTHCTPEGYCLAAEYYAREWSEKVLPEPITVQAYQTAARTPGESVRR